MRIEKMKGVSVGLFGFVVMGTLAVPVILVVGSVEAIAASVLTGLVAIYAYLTADTMTLTTISEGEFKNVPLELVERMRKLADEIEESKDD